MLLVQIVPKDRADKYLLWDKVATEVERNGAEAILAISEAWFAIFDPKNPNRHAGDDPQRREVLHLVAESETGENISLTSVFHRKQDGIEFEPTMREIGIERERLAMLEPVRRVWDKKKSG